MIVLPVVGHLTYREWHSFVDGLYSGARWGHKERGIQCQRHYWRGGYLLGTLSRYLLVATIVKLIRDT
jgi:hypothetical protein